jgi:hypothetical protein
MPSPVRLTVAALAGIQLAGQRLDRERGDSDELIWFITVFQSGAAPFQFAALVRRQKEERYA